METKFDLTVLNGKLFYLLTSYSKAKNEIKIPCLRKLPSTKITTETIKHVKFFNSVSTTRRISQKN